MKLVERDIDLGKLVVSEEQTAIRTPGVHVSTILRHIGTTLGTNKDNGFTEDDLNAFAIIGRLWERVLSEVLFPRPRYERIGEIECDGIIGSPDCIDTQEWADVEMKVTWVSAKGFIERQKFREYLWQCKSYCRMLSMPRAKIVVLHICGNYAPPVPIAREYNLVFTLQELAEHWQMMKRNIPQ